MFVQIENEYGSQGKALGAAGYDYMTWAANMAVGLKTGVPWVMCKEDDAPDPVVTIVLFISKFSLAYITLFHLLNKLQLRIDLINLYAFE